MSLSAMVWALKKAEAPDPISHLVLIGLADHAAEDGTGARPSAATLAQYARCSSRTVYKKLAALMDAGLIWHGDQQAVAHLRGDRRPTVYDLDINGVNIVHAVAHGVKQTAHGVNETTSRGEAPGIHGVNVSSDRTVLEPSMNRPIEPSEFASQNPDAVKLLDFLDSKIQANGAKLPTRSKKNLDAARLILNADGYTPEQVASLIAFATSNEFWRANILSMSKLREKADTLRLQLMRGTGTDKATQILRTEMERAQAADAARGTKSKEDEYRDLGF